MKVNIIRATVPFLKEELEKERAKSKKLRAQVKELKLDKAYLFAEILEYRTGIDTIKKDVRDAGYYGRS